MMTDLDAQLDAWQEQAAKEMTERSAIATKLMERDPQLGYISAITIAGDIMSADRSLRWLRQGHMDPPDEAKAVDFDTASVFVGSYARLDFKLRAVAEGLATPEQAADGLADEWSGSDPDDTDPRFLDLFRTAVKGNKGRILEQESPKAKLPGKQRFIVWRGQDMVHPKRLADPSTLYRDRLIGIAWSLNREVAERFARGAATRQHNRYGGVYAATIRRESILAFMPNRNEAEVIVDPTKLVDIHLVEVPQPAGVPGV